MKKTSSFNLEKDIYDEIEDYKTKLNLSSRNVALERMLLERRMLLIINPINQTPIKNIENLIDSNDVKEFALKSSITDSFKNMPD